MNSQKNVSKKERKFNLDSIQEILQYYNPDDIADLLRGVQQNYANCYIQILQHAVNSNELPSWFAGTLVNATSELSFLKNLADSFDMVDKKSSETSENS